MLDPICDMVVDLANARDQGLAPGRDDVATDVHIVALRRTPVTISVRRLTACQ